MSLLDGLSEPEQRQLKRLLRKLDRRAPPSSSRQSSDTRFRDGCGIWAQQPSPCNARISGTSRGLMTPSASERRLRCACRA